MKKMLFAVCLAMYVMFSVTGCGSGSGGSGTSSVEGSGTIADNTTSGSITLAWDAPTNSDGTPVVNVAGYNVHYGTSSGSYNKQINTGTQTTCTINGLVPGTYYLVVTCYDSSGNESGFSNEASKTVL